MKTHVTKIVLRSTTILAVLAVTCICRSDEPIALRRQRIDEMSSLEKQELEKKRARFERLPEQEQQRMRELHLRIQEHDEAERLQAVLERYAEWLMTVTASQRMDLRKLPVEERLNKIRETKRRLEEERFGRYTRHPLAPEDVRVVFDWLDTEVTLSEQERLEKMLTERDRHLLGRIDDESRRRVIMLKMLYRKHPDVLDNLSTTQIESLVNRLSPQAKAQYKTLPDADAQRRLAQQWIHVALTSRSAPPRISEQELEQFFATLDPSVREKLTQMPRDRMYRELGHMYFMHNRGRRFGGPRFGDGPPDRRFRQRGRRSDDRDRGRERRRPETRNESETESSPRPVGRDQRR